jgi:hypothetical protein
LFGSAQLGWALLPACCQQSRAVDNLNVVVRVREVFTGCRRMLLASLVTASRR